MSLQGQNIINQINLYIRNYPLEGFQDMRLNAILLQLVTLADAGGGGGSSAGCLKVTQANFSNATDCNLTALVGETLAVFMNDIPKFLDIGIDMHMLPGGGFGIDIPGFNATTNNYTFYVFIQTN